MTSTVTLKQLETLYWITKLSTFERAARKLADALRDVLRDQLEKHGVYLDPKENKWHSADGRTGAILVSTLCDEDIGKILANRQAARLRHDYKAADRLRDQLNEQCVSVDDKKNRWDAADGRSGNIEPFTCVHPPPAEAPPAAAAGPVPRRAGPRTRRGCSSSSSHCGPDPAAPVARCSACDNLDR